MEKNSYKLLRKNIPKIKLHSLTGQYWYDNFDNLVPWTDSINLPPSNGDLVYNMSTNPPQG